MTLTDLNGYIEQLLDSLRQEDRDLLKARLEGLTSVFPFNQYEYILTFLVSRQIVGFSDYEALRQNYVSFNKYLDLYGLAPRIFGQIWGEKHLMDLDQRFQKPNKILDKNYSGEYDLWLDGVKVEVKAARAIHSKKRGAILSKALHFQSEDPFWMNFQQLKLDVCDVFVFIGVWIDQIVYWVLANQEVKANQFLSHQHRGGVEYQIAVTNRNLKAFEVFQVEPSSVAKTVILKGQFNHEV